MDCDVDEIVKELDELKAKLGTIYAKAGMKARVHLQSAMARLENSKLDIERAKEILE